MRRLLADATPGEWEIREKRGAHMIWGPGGELAYFYNAFDGSKQGNANAALVVAVRRALPALLDVADAALRVLDELRDANGGLPTALDRGGVAREELERAVGKLGDD